MVILLALGPVLALAGLALHQDLGGGDTLRPTGVSVVAMVVLLWVQMVLIPQAAPGVSRGPRRALRWLRVILGLWALMLAAFARPAEGETPGAALAEMLGASIPALVLAGFALSEIGIGLLQRRKMRRIMRKQSLEILGIIAVIVALWTFWRGWGAALALWTGAVMLGGLACLIWPWGLSQGAAPGAPRYAARMAEVLSSGACFTLIHVLLNDPAATWAQTGTPVIGVMIGFGVAMYFQRAVPAYRV